MQPYDIDKLVTLLQTLAKELRVGQTNTQYDYDDWHACYEVTKPLSEVTARALVECVLKHAIEMPPDLDDDSEPPLL